MKYLAFPLVSLACVLVSSALLFAQSTTATTTTESGLKIKSLAPAEGAKKGDTVRVRYVGKFPDGREFDSSKSEPLEFQLGISPIITGWVQGIEGMQVGEKRHLTVPPELAYGAKGRDKIPPNATLEFDIQLVGLIRE